MASSSRGDVKCELFVAAFDGDLRLLKRLVKELDRGNGAAITIANNNDRGRTALHAAAAGGQFYVCKYLIDKLKLDVNLKDENGDTPLHHASIKEHLRTTTYLLEKGAHPSTGNGQGLTALHMAAKQGYKKLLRLLISKGAVVDAEAVFGTPLHCAATHGKKEAVKILLKNNANPNKFVQDCFSPLIESILSRSFECVKLLLEAGADVNTDLCGMTPLQVAAFEGETEITKSLLEAGANPNSVINNGLTPIEIAASHGNHGDVMVLFPVTSRISKIPDWSFDGIVKYVLSDEAREQRKLEQQNYFSYSKSKGEEAFKRKDCINALYWYSEAIYTDPNDAVVLMKRSLCWATLNKDKRALSDLQASLARSPEEKDLDAAFREAGQTRFSSP